jgi:hypothetical protein
MRRVFLDLCGWMAVTQVFGQTPGSAGAANSTTPASTTTSCPAAFGIYNPIVSIAPSASGSGSVSSPPSTTPTITVTQTVGGSTSPVAAGAPVVPAGAKKGGAGAAGGAAAPAPVPASTGAAKSGGASTPTQLPSSGIINLTQNVSAFDVATALSGKVTGVTLVPAGPKSLFYTIDPTKIGKAPLTVDEQFVNVTVAKVGGPTIFRTIPIAIQPSGTAKPGAGKAAAAVGGKFDILTRVLPDAVAGSDYSHKITIAHAPAGPLIWHYGPDTPKWMKFNNPPDGQIFGVPEPSAADVDRVLDQLTQLINSLPPVDYHLKVIRLPDGYTHACDILTAIGHQIPEVISMSVIDDSRILAGISGANLEVTARELTDLARELAISSVVPSPKVSSVLMQLYYDRDAVSVANAITQSFSQLKVSPVSTNATTSYADSLILADPTGSGQSDALEQARRMIALIDQPRPQITVNAWSLQFSSENQKKMRQLVPEARRFAAGYNDALERSITRGWTYLNRKVAGEPDYLDADFAEYLCAISEFQPNGTFAPKPQGKCPNGGKVGYSLGYTDIFDRVSPNLVQMMLLVMATKNASAEVTTTLNEMEDRDCSNKSDAGTGQSDARGAKTEESGRGYYRPCDGPFEPTLSCQQRDKSLYTAQFYGHSDKTAKQSDELGPNEKKEDQSATFDAWHQEQPPRYGEFECTRDRLQQLLTTSGSATTSYQGLFRGAVADFLFQNKMKAEYPDDFEPFLYPASAAKLDSALTPLTEAFNEDMQAFQQYLQNQLTYHIPKDKKLAYASNGLITVSVISGNQASVETQSLNYFPQNPTMKLENFAAQLVQGVNTATTTLNSDSKATTAVPAPSALGGTLSAIIPAIAAYSAAQPAQVTAKVGSGLSMTVTPYALSSDAGAELNVNVTYNENAAATISSDTTQAQTSDDLNSRVSEHAVTTLVRMDALKFFEISTMQSVIAREKAPYKLIDPVIELPLFDGLGVFPNWRRKPDVIYNQSVIFLQAAIMPTAADLGNSIRMQYDRVVCTDAYLTARAKTDFGPERCGHDAKEKDTLTSGPTHTNELDQVMEYHRRMVRYFSGSHADAVCNENTSSDSAEAENCVPRWSNVLPQLEDTSSSRSYPVTKASPHPSAPTQ